LRLPYFALLAELPGLSVTNSGRMRALYLLAMALLAGYGLDVVRQGIQHSIQDSGAVRPLRWLARMLAALGIVAALGAVAAYLLVTRFYDQLIELGRSQVQAAAGNPFFFLPVE